MSQLKTAQLTVAKICHELATPLSIVRFIQEDLAESEVYELTEMTKSIDVAVLTMDFFRLIYSATSSREVQKSIFKLLTLKEITVRDHQNVFETESEECINILCGILYLIMKSCKPQDIVDISLVGDTITIQVPNRSYPTEVERAFNCDTIEPNIFNVFVLYLKQLAQIEGFNIQTEKLEKGIKTRIWIQK